MKRTYRTYQWVDGRVEEVGSMHAIDAKPMRQKLRKIKEDQPVIDTQTALLLFTFCSVVMVFAGGALFAFSTFVWGVITG